MTFVTGASTQDVCIPVTLVDDTIKEMEEFFPFVIDSVSEGSTVGSPNVTTMRIRDNDGMYITNTYIEVLPSLYAILSIPVLLHTYVQFVLWSELISTVQISQ